jgi:hypothetical protein
VVPRAVPICEAMVATVLLDHWLIGQAYSQHVQSIRSPKLNFALTPITEVNTSGPQQSTETKNE